MTMMSWTTLLNILCAALPIITFASPATVFLPALWKKSDSNDRNGGAIEMSPLALTSQMLQCFMFGIYAYHLHMRTLLIPNAVGFVLGFLWSTIYPFKVIKAAPPAPDNGLLLQWRIQYAVSLLLMLLGSLTVRRMPNISSTIAAVVGVLMCTYPLPSMRQAYREKNANLMGSAVMNLTMLATCTVWVIHGSWLVDYNLYVLLPNSAGVIVQASALVLRVIIGRMTRVEKGGGAPPSVSSPLLS